MVPALSLPANLSLVEISGAASSRLRTLFGAPAHLHIPYHAETRAERNLLAAKLDAAVTRADGAVLLVAEGASCFAAAWWARLSPAPYVARVAGALFFDPVADGESVDVLSGTFASPRTRLPFPSILLGGEDRAALGASIRALADTWGSGLDNDEAEGDTAGPLERTRRMVERFTAGVVKREVRTARALIGHPRLRGPGRP